MARAALWIKYVCILVLTKINKASRVAMPTCGADMVNIFKAVTSLGIVAAIAWFEVRPDFAPVITGIMCLSLFMMTFLLTTGGEEG